MNARWSRFGRVAALAAVCCGWGFFAAPTLWAQRPSTQRHVRELGRYLDGVKIAEPARYGHLAVYPVLVDDVPLLRGRWLTADAAISRGVLLVSEKPGGSVVRPPVNGCTGGNFSSPQGVSTIVACEGDCSSFRAAKTGPLSRTGSRWRPMS